MSPESTDLEVIAHYKATRDQQYLGKLFQRYKYLVVGICMKYLQHKEEAKDASMDIYEELISKVLEFEIKNFKSWLSSVARNHCLMKIRKTKGISEVDVQNEKIENQFMESADFEHLVTEKQDESEVLLEAIEQLKDGQRECIRLFYLKELSYKEVADITQLDLKQVKSNIQNGKRNLQLILAQALKD
ncbi:MAG: sigma-70 family RNA polymerase sigma factor [Bacteroidetes bacterium]|nr:sigma-70 family RNA polymerase sigma factor [Bacteroidota bacterium]MBP6639129.1 sigma-70 family RNA polymerase sigma factor [Bacteroidia bacterium]MBP6720965.1 sigma-70 family RNA polymerase sigma factor [Bacteroidia bacterium]MBP8073728.1 sigma-70 family RNA polymerase sigma factor [Bacteroidia bacterium]